MTKYSVLAISSTAMFLILSVLAYIIPEPAGTYVAMFTLPLFFALLLGITVGGICPAFLLIAPLAAHFITHEGDFLMNTLPEIALICGAGVFAGIAYGKFRTVIGSNLFGFFAGVLLYGLFRLIGCLIRGEAYQLLNLLSERFLECWPGVLLCLIAPPLIGAILRKTGVLKVLRDGMD